MGSIKPEVLSRLNDVSKNEDYTMKSETELLSKDTSYKRYTKIGRRGQNLKPVLNGRTFSAKNVFRGKS